MNIQHPGSCAPCSHLHSLDKDHRNDLTTAVLPSRNHDAPVETTIGTLQFSVLKGCFFLALCSSSLTASATLGRRDAHPATLARDLATLIELQDLRGRIDVSLVLLGFI
jgi:hypothetical protein